MFFIAYTFKGHVHAFAGQVKVVSHSSCRTSAIFKYFCPLHYGESLYKQFKETLITAMMIDHNKRYSMFSSFRDIPNLRMIPHRSPNRKNTSTGMM